MLTVRTERVQISKYQSAFKETNERKGHNSANKKSFRRMNAKIYLDAPEMVKPSCATKNLSR